MLRIGLRVAASIAFAFAALVQAQSYPARPVRLIVPFPPGGSVDVVARALTPKLSERMGQQVVIENRSGASGIIGTEVVAHAKPDGYTLLINTIPFVTNTYLYSKVPYDPFADFLPVAWLCSSPATLVVNPSVPARSVRELLALAKSKPGALNYSAAGAGVDGAPEYCPHSGRGSNRVRPAIFCNGTVARPEPDEVLR